MADDGSTQSEGSLEPPTITQTKSQRPTQPNAPSKRVPANYSTPPITPQKMMSGSASPSRRGPSLLDRQSDAKRIEWDFDEGAKGEAQGNHAKGRGLVRPGLQMSSPTAVSARQSAQKRRYSEVFSAPRPTTALPTARTRQRPFDSLVEGFIRMTPVERQQHKAEHSLAIAALDEAELRTKMEDDQ